MNTVEERQFRNQANTISEQRKEIIELAQMLNRAETQCERLGETISHVHIAMGKVNDCRYEAEAKCVGLDNVLRAMTSESEPSEVVRLRATVAALETDWANAQGKLPLISRARAESATGTQWCNGQEFTADEKEDITRYIIYGACIQQSKDGEVIIPLQAQLERIVSAGMNCRNCPCSYNCPACDAIVEYRSSFRCGECGKLHKEGIEPLGHLEKD